MASVASVVSASLELAPSGTSVVVVEDDDVDGATDVDDGYEVAIDDVGGIGSVGSGSSGTEEVDGPGSSLPTVPDDPSVDDVVDGGAASAVGPGASTAGSSDTLSIEFHAIANPNAS